MHKLTVCATTDIRTVHRLGFANFTQRTAAQIDAYGVRLETAPTGLGAAKLTPMGCG